MIGEIFRKFNLVSTRLLSMYCVQNTLFTSRFSSIQSSSVAQSCPTLCDPMDCSTPGLPVHHQLQSLPKLMSIESVIPSNHLILSSPSPNFNLSQHQGLFKWVRSLHQVAEVLESQLQHQSFQWTLRTDLLRMDWLDLHAVKGLSRVFSNTTVQKHQFFSAQLSL